MNLFRKQKSKKEMEKGTLHETLFRKEAERENRQTPTEDKEGSEESKKNGQEHPNNGEVGPLAGIIIILLVLVGGASYFFVSQIKESNTSQTPQVEDILEQKDPITQQLKQQSSSDDIETIEKDLKNTPVDKLDKGVKEIKKELEI